MASYFFNSLFNCEKQDKGRPARSPQIFIAVIPRENGK